MRAESTKLNSMVQKRVAGSKGSDESHLFKEIVLKKTKTFFIFQNQHKGTESIQNSIESIWNQNLGFKCTVTDSGDVVTHPRMLSFSCRALL